MSKAARREQVQKRNTLKRSLKAVCETDDELRALWLALSNLTEDANEPLNKVEVALAEAAASVLERITPAVGSLRS